MAPESDDVAQLYRRYGPAVHRRALSLLRDPQEALDVTQETFLAFLKQREGLRGEAAPFTVLYQIATYRAVDRLRRTSRWSGTLQVPDVSEDETTASGHAVGDADESGARRVEAAKDLALLTRGEKPDVLTAALLYFVEGYTTEEVAQTMELSRKTVGKMLAQFSERARKRKSRLDLEGGEP